MWDDDNFLHGADDFMGQCDIDSASSFNCHYIGKLRTLTVNCHKLNDNTLVTSKLTRVAAVLADRAFSRQPKIGKFNRQFNENEQLNLF